MSTTEKRLDQAAEGLTARERATVVLKVWMDSGELDKRLTKNAPGDQRQECDRIVDAVGQANENLHHDCAFLLEWVWQEETQVTWLQSLAAFIDRTEHLEAALRVAGWKVEQSGAPALQRSQKRVSLRPLPAPRLGLERDLPLLWGTTAFPDDQHETPTTWPAVRDHLAFELRRGLQMRWQDLAARRVVLDELSEAMGGVNMTHPQVAGALDALHRKVLELYEALVDVGGPFELGGADEERIANARTWVNWDDIREAPPNTANANNGRGWMRPEELAELEALEARLATELRTDSDSR
ncbi:MAG: hypothetical protein ABIQ47_10675 [Tepidiformaceae bacterium]